MTPWFWLFSAILLLLGYMRFEASWLEICHAPAPLRENRHRAGLRVALISDLHPLWCRVSARRARRAMELEKPDLMLFLGDAVDYRSQITTAARWLGTVTAGIPAMAVLGNHDHQLFDTEPALMDEYRKALASVGIRLCADEQLLWTKDGVRLRLTALDDYRKKTEHLPPSAPEAQPEDVHLVFTHNPQRLASLPHAYADFAVAGHFHGGQIWMPFGLEFRLFRKEPLGRSGVRRGMNTVNGIPCWLSRGIGSVLFPLRLGARPEITMLDL